MQYLYSGGIVIEVEVSKKWRRILRENNVHEKSLFFSKRFLGFALSRLQKIFYGTIEIIDIKNQRDLVSLSFTTLNFSIFIVSFFQSRMLLLYGRQLCDMFDSLGSRRWVSFFQYLEASFHQAQKNQL